MQKHPIPKELKAAELIRKAADLLEGNKYLVFRQELFERAKKLEYEYFNLPLSTTINRKNA